MKEKEAKEGFLSARSARTRLRRCEVVSRLEREGVRLRLEADVVNERDVV